ncbi:transketolase [Buchnera aphidicola (Formosaphis micheliae)]|uniref:transketolase n=1 Tax=Buchnera aphidicola TaxID=9 RepID=UPI0031B8ABE4
MYSNSDLSNAIRCLSIDAIQRANSGHPGMPMGMADIAMVLWRQFLKHNPKNPLWDNRDRFILSNGHGSMLLYSILHLTGYDLSINDLKNFRQLNSKTPGHPEIGCTPGIEITTGPLGQGLAAAVGMAIAERSLGSYFNRYGYNIIDHYTWVFIGDGCLMEGISHEVCSLAGTFGLGKLIVFYDRNGISIDGNTNDWFNDDTSVRFQSYYWHVVNNVDGHNIESIKNAIIESKSVIDKPSIIICDTVIGFGSPNKSGKSESHGSPLGNEEVLLTKKKLNWLYKPFYIPEEIYSQWDASIVGEKLEKQWKKEFKRYEIRYPVLAEEYRRRMNKKLPSIWDREMEKFIQLLQKSPQTIATRQASQNTLELIGSLLNELIGGSADLSPSNLTIWSGSKSIKNDFSGNYIHYGVREFGMTAISNGISHHGGFIPYSATFLIFVEYAKNAVRMAALMKTQQILIYTHDSIGLGEDGPTHQPIEQLSCLRFTPNLSVWRPSDQVETAIAWKYAIERQQGPTALILSRQNVPQLFRTNIQLIDVKRGGYILNQDSECPEIIIISTGSELKIAVEVAKALNCSGHMIRVVSMPSTDVFDQQNLSYRESVLPPLLIKRVAIEAGITDFWYKYVGLNGLIIGMNSFGESAPAKQLYDKFGFNVQDIVRKIKLHFSL